MGPPPPAPRPGAAPARRRREPPSMCVAYAPTLTLLCNCDDMINAVHRIVFAEPRPWRCGGSLPTSSLELERSPYAGHGWPTSCLPPAELAVHPAEEGGVSEGALT